jgi:hypothetical protein
MGQIIGGIIFVGVGFCFVIFNKKVAQISVKLQKDFFHLRFDVELFQICFFVGGLLAAAIGILALVDVIKF